MRTYVIVAFLLLFPLLSNAQPETAVEEWQGKTILLIGAHPDDDIYSQGTLAILQEHRIWKQHQFQELPGVT